MITKRSNKSQKNGAKKQLTVSSDMDSTQRLLPRQPSFSKKPKSKKCCNCATSTSMKATNKTGGSFHDGSKSSVSKTARLLELQATHANL
jgi:hypothetical protein